MSEDSLERFLGRLNPPQREAVETLEGPLLVLAGAGTGKTRVITLRIARLLATGTAEARHILGVTFTNKAAREMRERVAGLVGKERAKPLTLSTFHSFAVRLLRRFGDRLGYPENFGIADPDDLHTLLRSTLREMGISEKEVSPGWGLSQISSWKTELLDPDAALDAAADAAEVSIALAYRRLDEEMRRRRVVDFDDMLRLAVKLFNEHPEVLDRCRDRFRYILVDEFQDTNESQYELIRRLAQPRRNLCVVGDDDQSIYGWRGARAGNILDFPRHFPGTRVVTLAQNYRSTNRILGAANAVIANNPGRREKDLWSGLGEGRNVHVYEAPDERGEVLHVVSGISALRARGVAWKDIAVLFRANAQSNALELAFRERDFPYTVTGVRSLFDRRECRDVLAYLKVIVNPRDDGALLRVLNTPARGIGKTTRDRLLELAVEKRKSLYELISSGEAEATAKPRARDALAAFREVMAKLATAVEEGPLDRAIESLLEDIGYRAWLEMEAKEPLDAQVRWNVVTQLVQSAEWFRAKQPDAKLRDFLEMLALDDRADTKDDDENAIGLYTVHAAKGLEFDYVFLVGVEEGFFPHKNSLGLGEELDTIEEERRLFYVAVTRARREIDLTLAATRRRWGRDEERTISRFIEEMGDDGVEKIDPSTQGPADEASTASYLDRLKGLVSSSEDDA